MGYSRSYTFIFYFYRVVYDGNWTVEWKKVNIPQHLNFRKLKKNLLIYDLI